MIGKHRLLHWGNITYKKAYYKTFATETVSHKNMKYWTIKLHTEIYKGQSTMGWICISDKKEEGKDTEYDHLEIKMEMGV